MSEIQSNVAIPLPKNKRNMVQFGGVLLMLSSTMAGLSLATLQAPILTEMNAMKYFSLLSIFSTLGLVIMTPIGGKLGDLIGRRNIVFVSGIVCAICSVGMSVTRNFQLFMIFRLLLGAGQGAFISTPYILAREINEPKEVPKVMGMLSSSIAVGGFTGSIIAGILRDMGYLNLAIVFPVLPLIAGVLMIFFNLPNKKREGKVNVDILGMVALTAALSGILLSLNFGTNIGWSNIKIIGGLIIGIISLIAFIFIENKVQEPIIPMYLFKNKNYVSLIILGFICYFYMSAMNVFAPLAVQKVIGSSSTVAGALQMPRTIVTMILPMFVGLWVSKGTQNLWKSMIIGTLFVALPFAVLSMTSKETSVMVYFTALAATGIAESFRAVSITPAAQATLEPKDLGVGTSLINFVNTLSLLVSAAVYGIAYDIRTNGDSQDIGNITDGVNSVFRIGAVVSVIGLLLVIFVIRKQIENKK
ncbi:MAG: MFS transporter [Leptotrichiaceae bacterium]|nr:MFS transporter [Leptotrichiaceae bacterium]